MARRPLLSHSAACSEARSILISISSCARTHSVRLVIAGALTSGLGSLLLLVGIVVVSHCDMRNWDGEEKRR